MRKKSHVTVQKWVDSIAVTAPDDKHSNCDSKELNVDEEPSTSGGSGTSVKGKFTEICNKFNVNEKLRSKKIDLKNLITKTTQKYNKKDSSPIKDILEPTSTMEQQQNDDESSEKRDNDEREQIDDKNGVNPNDRTVNKDTCDAKEEQEITTNEDESNLNKLTVQRCHISVLGRSSSENPNPPLRNKRLNDIGRSFSVANDNELPTDSTDNLIYDADESLLSSVLSMKAASNNQLDKNSSTLRPTMGTVRPLREHTVSEGHYSPHVLPKNPLLRDSSFQVSIISFFKMVLLKFNENLFLLV